ncbi:hypothetical protein AwDysgo_01350 [Bacteroidales bacterium]|nr:hypothetical protein AwDysgo_01350 [Bacteroidales bacterium]
MKKTKYISLYISLFMGLLILTGACSDYLDKDPKTDTSLNYEQIFKDPHLAPGFLNNAYNQLPDGFLRFNENALLAGACDEAKHSLAGSRVQLFNSNAISPSDNPDNAWQSMYTGIRKCNIFLKELDGLIAKYNSIPEASRSNFRGQALFLRAFFHFELLKRYQNIICVDKVLDAFDEEEAYSIKQSTFKEALAFIVADCDSAEILLPAKVDADGSQNGRPSKVAPMALKARMLLYAASPLNNPSNDVEQWKKAETAAKEIYDRRSALGISLNSSYAGTFTSPYNAEIIFATQANNRNDVEFYNFPISYQGAGFTNPSQNLVDAYVMNGTEQAEPMKDFDPENPYSKREERFYATILHNDANFKGSKVESFVGGKDGLYSTSTATKTGYYMNKFISSSLSLEKNERARKPWILYRYAEVLLNYAEARNEVLDAPDKIVHDILNLIRSRAKLRPFRNATVYIKTKEEMRDYIKKERQVELALEEHRFWDLRRWKDAEIALNKALIGMRVEKQEAKLSFQSFEVEKRMFDPKLYWYPIPRSEMLKYRSKGIELTQNPGWNN